LGPYIDTLVKLNADKSVIENVIARFAQHLEEACLGQVSEIFDADPPHHPRGCVAQAWGIGEILRVLYEHDLYTQTPELIADTAGTGV
jgi:glycogen debranching enzyme